MDIYLELKLGNLINSGGNIFYLAWYLCLCQYCSKCRVYNDLMLVQDTIYIMIREHRCIDGVAFRDFLLYIPMLLMVHIQNCVRRLPICMLRFRG